jgi:hypothetical protein
MVRDIADASTSFLRTYACYLYSTEMRQMKNFLGHEHCGVLQKNIAAVILFFVLPNPNKGTLQL